MAILEISATLLTLVSVYCMTNDRLYHGWLVGASGNLLWILYAMNIESGGLAVVNATMFVLYLRSITLKGKAYV